MEQGPQPIVLGPQFGVVRAKCVDLLIRGVEPLTQFVRVVLVGHVTILPVGVVAVTGFAARWTLGAADQRGGISRQRLVAV